MNVKKSETKFTIKFKCTDHSHLEVADILNRLKRYDKAQYIVDAILYYTSRNKKPDIKRQALVVDEKLIEAVVIRILNDREETGMGKSTDAVSVRQSEKILQATEDINFDDAMETIGVDGFNAVTNVLDMFRKK
jgi:hypothetical protein